MLTLDVKINGIPVGVIYLHNTGITKEKGNRLEHLYKVQFFEYSKRLKEFDVFHAREDKVWVLLNKVFEKVIKKDE